MMKDIVEARPLDGYELYLRFEDGTDGVVDIAKLISFHGVFEPLESRAYFEQVQVNTELGTVFWPNGADLDPDVLHAVVSGVPIPSYQGIRR